MITIWRYPVRESVILDAQRLGVLTGQYIGALRLCSMLRLFKEAVKTITKAALKRGYGVQEQKKTLGQVLAGVVGRARHHDGGNEGMVHEDAEMGKEGDMGTG